MRYKVFGDMMPAVSIQLDAGESIYTQSGGMAWMTDGIHMDTNLKGGLGKSLGRLFSGESLFMATYTANVSGAEITIASTMPGTIRVLEVQPGREYIAQKGAFLCATPGVTLSAEWSGMKGGFFGGEGFILQRISGRGLVFLELDGAVCDYELAPSQRMIVDTGNVAFFEAQVGYSAQLVRGFKNVLFGGEGLFLTTLTGPGHIWLQTMTVSELAGKLIPYLPTPNN